MAILVRGKTKCSLCGEVIKAGEGVVSFLPFISNPLSPLFEFSDAAFHADCFHRHPFAEKVHASYKETVERSGPGNRFCVVCQREITHPDDYFTLGHLTAERASPLYKYNHTQLHRSCLGSWPELSQVHRLLDELQCSGRWKGAALEKLLDEVRRNLPQYQEDNR